MGAVISRYAAAAVAALGVLMPLPSWSIGLDALTAPATPTAEVQCVTVATPVYATARWRDLDVFATDGGLAFRDAQGDERLWTACDGLASTSVMAVAGDETGLWVGYRGRGVWFLDPKTGEHRPVSASTPEMAWPTSLAVADATVFVGTVAFGLWSIEPDGEIRQPLRRFRSRRVSALTVGPDGSVWIGRDLGGLWRYRPRLEGRAARERRVYRGSVQTLRLEGTSVVVGRGGDECVWVEKDKCEPVETANRWFATSPTAGLQSNHFTSLEVAPAVDGTTTLWAGTFDRGLYRRAPNQAWEPASRNGPRFINALARRGTELWVATPVGLYRHRSEQGPDAWTRFGEDAGLPSDHVNQVGVHAPVAGHAADLGVSCVDDELWVATSQGLAKWDHAGIHRYTTDDGLPYRIAYAVAAAEDSVWVGTAYGMGHRAAGDARWTQHRAGRRGPSDNWIQALSVQPDGTTLVGTYDAGVDLWTPDGRFESVRAVGPVWVNPGGLVRSSEHEGVFVSTLGDGLVFLGDDGRWAQWKSRGLVGDDVTDVASAPDGLWIATRSGLTRWPSNADDWPEPERSGQWRGLLEASVPQH